MKIFFLNLYSSKNIWNNVLFRKKDFAMNPKYYIFVNHNNINTQTIEKMKKTSAIVICLTILLSPFILNAQQNFNAPLKLRMGSYNVGHFNQGEPGGYHGEDFDAEMKRWRQWIGEQSMDVFFINEWNGVFDKDSTLNAADELLYPYYNNVIFGKEFRWINNGIATNFHIDNIRQFELTHKEYYAIVADMHIEDKIITLMSVHVPWQKCCHESSLDMLIEEMKKYEYVICGGDINASNKNQLRFTEQGFNIANGGNEGWFCTWSKNCDKEDKEKHNASLDNIITSKNIKIMNVSAPQNRLTDKDHWPLLADIIITW